MLRRNGPVVKSVKSVLTLEGSLWWERFVKEAECTMRVDRASGTCPDIDRVCHLGFLPPFLLPT